jgi:hypothetical protein
MKKILVFLTVTILLAVSFLNVFAQHGEINKVPHGINSNSNSPNWPGFALTTGSTRKVTAMNYYGGPLITTPTIYLIWYGNWAQSNGSDNANGQQIIRDWAAGIGGTPYYQLNKSLSVSAYTISGNVNFVAGAGHEINDTGTTSTSYSKSLTDANITAIVGRNIGSGKLNDDPNGVYFVVTSSDVNETSGFCTQYCGWHTSDVINGTNRRYSFVGNANRCLSACAAQSKSPNGNAGVDGAVSVLSHELEEANTDPDINAWLDSRGAENADKCAWTFGHHQLQAANGSFYNMTFNNRQWLIQRNILKSGSSFYCMVDSLTN